MNISMKGMFDDIREKMEGWQEPAPDGLWERIEAASAENRNRRGKFIRILRWSAATAGAAAAVVLFLLIPPHTRTGVEEPLSTDVLPAPEARPLTADIQPLPEIEAPIINKHMITGLDIRRPLMPHRTAEESNNKVMANTYLVHEKATASRKEAETGGIKWLSNNGPDSKDLEKSTEAQGRVLSAESNVSSAARGMFSIGISATNAAGSSSSENGYTSMSGFSAYPLAMATSPTALWVDPEANMLRANQGMDVTSDTRHRLPITTGISVRYRLPIGLGFETGVNYTWLSSTFRSGSESSYYTSERTMHYIGIPLNVNYTIWDSRYLGVYVSVGGLMEKCVGGSTATRYTLNSESLGSERQGTLDVKPLQWSVNATAGIQFNITPAIGLYAEPGAAYWFDDGTELETIYKVRPLNFYLRFGLRFSFGL